MAQFGKFHVHALRGKVQLINLVSDIVFLRFLMGRDKGRANLHSVYRTDPEQEKKLEALRKKLTEVNAVSLHG